MLLPISSPQLPLPPQLIIKKTDLPKPKQFYTIQNGDNLTTIAETHSVDLSRLWAANPQLANPDVLAVADPLQIPEKDEVLADRPMPVSIEPTASRSTTGTPVTRGSSISGGFDTSLGWCTNYIARRRPIPAWFQNADMWLIDARQAGMATGTTPQVGAVAVAASYMHVAYVEKVEGDKVYVSEMNYVKYDEVDYRWTPLSEWQGYIYP